MTSVMLATCIVLLCLICNVSTKTTSPRVRFDIYKRLSNALNSFGLEYFQIMARQKKQDNFYMSSPFGLGLCLSTVLAASEGRTAAELNYTLRYQNLSLDEVSKAFHEIFEKKYLVNYDIDIYNAIIHRKDIQLTPTFAEIATKEFFFKDIPVTDFRNNDTFKIISEIIKQDSNGTIDKAFYGLGYGYGKSEVIVYNKINFDGVWKNGFALNSGLLNKVGLFPYGECDELQATLVELTYSSTGGQLVIIRPRRADEIYALEKLLTNSLLKKAMKSMRGAVVNVSMPTYGFLRKGNVDALALSRMGTKAAFDKNLANLPGLVNNDLRVSVDHVVQHIEFKIGGKGDKEPSEPSTYVPFGELIVPKQFSLKNHPFLFLVIDRYTDIIFFIGSSRM